MIDCEKLPGHLRQICTGEYRRSNGHPYSDDERAEIIGRFLRELISPEDLPESSEAARISSFKKSDVGTRLHEIIERDAGRIECGECRDEVTRLNFLSASDVLAEADSIADGIVSRGKRKAPKFWQRWGATLAPGVAKLQALAWIREACGVEEQ
jgi:hypothetical protein